MLTDEQLEIFAAELVPIFQQLEQAIIADIARRMVKESRWTETAELQASALRELGFSPYRIRLEVMRKLQLSPEYIAMIDKNTMEYKAVQQAAIDEAKEAIRALSPELFDAIGNMSFNNDLSVWKQAGQKLTRGGAADNLIKAAQKRAAGELMNLTKTMGFKTPTGVIGARKAFTVTMNNALTQVVTGTMSYQQACSNAVRTLSRGGLRHIDFQSGVTRQLDTAARNALLTASAQLTGDIMETNIEASGAPMVQVSQHWGARESHALWQGGIYTVEQFKAVCGYGNPSNPDHIYSYNCRHTHYPYWPGISEPMEFEPEPGPFEIDGRQYSYYQATQKQRGMERDIRALKRDALADDAMGDKSALAASRIKINEKLAEYRRFSSQTKIRAKLERTTVFGYDRGVAARGRAAATQQTAARAARDRYINQIKPMLAKNNVPLADALSQEVLSVDIETKGKYELHSIAPQGASITDVRIIAGYGVADTFRNASKFAGTIGGEDYKWQKIGGLIKTDNYVYDIHWHQYHGSNAHYGYELKGVREVK